MIKALHTQNPATHAAPQPALLLALHAQHGHWYATAMTINASITLCIFRFFQVTPLQAVGTATSEFDIPAAPILLPEGPWKEIDGCVCAPKGFKAQGRVSCTTGAVCAQPTMYP